MCESKDLFYIQVYTTRFHIMRNMPRHLKAISIYISLSITQSFILYISSSICFSFPPLNEIRQFKFMICRAEYIPNISFIFSHSQFLGLRWTRFFPFIVASFPAYFYKVAVPRARNPCRATLTFVTSEGCARGRNQVRRHEARFSVLLRIGQIHRKVTRTRL